MLTATCTTNEMHAIRIGPVRSRPGGVHYFLGSQVEALLAPRGDCLRRFVAHAVDTDGEPFGYPPLYMHHIHTGQRQADVASFDGHNEGMGQALSEKINVNRSFVTIVMLGVLISPVGFIVSFALAKIPLVLALATASTLSPLSPLVNAHNQIRGRRPPPITAFSLSAALPLYKTIIIR